MELRAHSLLRFTANVHVALIGMEACMREIPTERVNWVSRSLFRLLFSALTEHL
jgi:hypothetical protein